MTCGVHSRLRLLEEACSIQKDERRLPFDGHWAKKIRLFLIGTVLSLMVVRQGLLALSKSYTRSLPNGQ